MFHEQWHWQIADHKATQAPRHGRGSRVSHGDHVSPPGHVSPGAWNHHARRSCQHAPALPLCPAPAYLVIAINCIGYLVCLKNGQRQW